MEIKKLIKVLQMWEKEYGNIQVVMSTDSEGNSYSTLEDRFSFSPVRDGEDDFIGRMIAEKKLNSMTKEEKEFCDKAKIVGICLYPFGEGFETAEEAVKKQEK